MDPKEFIDTISGAAQDLQQKYSILTSITLAQAALETGWGRSIPEDKYTGQLSYNLFGIKGEGPAGSVTCDTREFRGNRMVEEEAQFRAYNNWLESLEDHCQLLLTDWYKPVRDAVDYREAARRLQSCGYATDPSYAQKLIQLIDQYYLHQYDVLPVPFPDIPPSHWAVPLLTRLKEAGVVVGDEGTRKVRGDDPPTRYEMFAFGDAIVQYIKSIL